VQERPAHWQPIASPLNYLGMTAPPVTDRQSLRMAVLDGLARLRTEFPLETRLQQALPELRQVYGQILAQWLQAMVPQTATFDTTVLQALQQLDAVTVGPEGIGCYPFSAQSTEITVQMPRGAVQAMCAIDALAIARLANATTRIVSDCVSCATPLTLRVETNGGLDHDQADLAHVVWRHATEHHASCSRGLCRGIRFLCTRCAPPDSGTCLSLPQAAAIGNAFFAFQRALLPAGSGT